MRLKCLPVHHTFLLKWGLAGQFSLSQRPLWRPKLENPLPSSPHLFLTLRTESDEVPVCTCSHTMFIHIEYGPSQPMRWIKEDQWGRVLSGLAGVEASFPASPQLNGAGMSIQLHLFPRIITLSWLQTNPSLGVLVAEHCVPFSADRWASGERLITWRPLCEPVRVVAHVTPSK